MHITLMRVNKKINSTRRTASAELEVNCQFKAPCSDLNPEFTLTVHHGEHNVNFYNMIYADGKYYNITDITYEAYDVCTVSCSIDVLATYRNQIISSTQYVTRISDENFFNDSAIDSQYPALIGKSIYTSTYSNVFDKTNGFYVIGLVCSADNEGAGLYLNFGSVKYFAVTLEELTRIMTMLYNAKGYLADTNPIQYVTSCFYVPFAPYNAQASAVTVSINFGGSTTYQINPILALYQSTTIADNNGVKIGIKSGILPVPINNDIIAERGSGYRSEPYSHYYIYAGPFGTIHMDSALLSLYNSIDYSIDIDVVTGKGKLTLSKYNNVLNEITAQLGVFIQLSQISKDSLLGIISSGISAATSIATGNPIGAASAILSAVENSVPKLSSVGNNGSMIDYNPSDIRFVCETSKIADESLDVYGRPCLTNIELSEIALGSYIQIDTPVISILGAKNPEIEAIISFMQNGFYLE